MPILRSNVWRVYQPFIEPCLSEDTDFLVGFLAEALGVFFGRFVRVLFVI